MSLHWRGKTYSGLFYGSLSFLAMGFIAACNPQDWIVPEKEKRLAQHYIELIRTQDVSGALAAMDPVYRTPNSRSVIDQLALLFPQEKPRSVKDVGSNMIQYQDSTVYNQNFEMEFSHEWILMGVVIKKVGNAEVIEGVHASVMTQSLEALNAFTFKNKPAANYNLFALAVTIPLFIVFTLIAAIRTPIPRRKWLWYFFIAFGVCQLTFNWTSGAMAFNLLSFQLLGAGFMQMSYGPLVLQIGFPLGAIVFWMRYKKWHEQFGMKEPADIPSQF